MGLYKCSFSYVAVSFLSVKQLPLEVPSLPLDIFGSGTSITQGFTTLETLCFD